MMLFMVEVAAVREAESRAVAQFLDRVPRGPAGLVFEGEPGIGKTALWAGAVRLAAGSGFRVLSARASAAEVRLTFAVLADLLDDVDLAVIERLAPVQRVALDRALLRGNAGPPTDERVAAAAFLSVLEVLAQRSTVLVAIDDLQWLDSPSRAVIGFAVRRLKGPIGIVATARTGAGDHPGEPWLHLPDPGRLAVLRLRPLSLGALHAVIKARLGRTLPRPVITQIHKVSAGNPLYAVKLARNLDADLSPGPLSMPESLNALVRHRLGTVSDETSALLLAAAARPIPRWPSWPWPPRPVLSES